MMRPRRYQARREHQLEKQTDKFREIAIADGLTEMGRVTDRQVSNGGFNRSSQHL